MTHCNKVYHLVKVFRMIFMLWVPLQEARVCLSVGEAGTPHSDVLQQPEVLHLMAAAILLEEQRGLDIVGLDAADIVGFLQRVTVC